MDGIIDGGPTGRGVEEKMGLCGDGEDDRRNGPGHVLQSEPVGLRGWRKKGQKLGFVEG